MLNATFQSHPIKIGCCNTITKSLIVATINPIWHSRPVNLGTKIFNICSLKSKENIIFAHYIYFRKTQTNQATSCLDFQSSLFSPFIRIIYFILFAINTHIDCLNNSKCSVRYIFKATKQGALKVSLCIFC